MHHGNEGTVKVGSNAVAEVQSWSYDEADMDVQEVASLGDTAATYYPSGIKTGGGSIDCMWDEADTTGQGALLPGASVTLNLYPEGATTGDTYFTGTAVVTATNRGGAVNGMVKASFQFKGVLTSAVAA